MKPIKLEAFTRLLAADVAIPSTLVKKLKQDKLPLTQSNALDCARSSISICKHFGDTKSKEFREAQSYLDAVIGTKRKLKNIQIDPKLQAFIVTWVEKFGKGSKAGTAGLFKKLAELEPSIPNKLKKVSGTLYRGFRMPIRDFNALLTGKSVAIQSRYLSFSTDLEVAESFATQDAKGTVGVLIKQQPKNVVLNIGKVFNDLGDAIANRTKHFDDLAEFENEVVLDNSKSLQVDPGNVVKVYMSWKDLPKLNIPEEQRKQLERMDSMDNIVVTFNGKIPRVLRT